MIFQIKKIKRYSSIECHRDDNTIELYISLPEGKTQVELVKMTDEFLSIEENRRQLYGKNVVIIGKATMSMCLYLGHFLAQICQCQTVSVFDPKTNNTILVIKH